MVRSRNSLRRLCPDRDTLPVNGGGGRERRWERGMKLVIGAPRRAHQSLDRMREQLMLYGMVGPKKGRDTVSIGVVVRPRGRAVN